MQKLAYVVLICTLLVHSKVFASCGAKAGDRLASYSKAKTFVYALPEVKAWKKLVYSAGRKIITIPSNDHQSLINGKCYWSVNLYEDIPDHVTRWNMFYVGVNDNHILVDDITGGDPMTLQQWHAQLKRLHSNQSIKRDTLKASLISR